MAAGLFSVTITTHVSLGQRTSQLKPSLPSAAASSALHTAQHTPKNSATSIPSGSITQSTDDSREAIKLLLIGDSLTSGYGVSSQETYPALALKKLASRGWPITIINTSIPGPQYLGLLQLVVLRACAGMPARTPLTSSSL